MVYILGINAYHGDLSACILKSNQLVAAAEEERFLRVKHWAGFPKEAIKYCLDEAKITIDEGAYPHDFAFLFCNDSSENIKSNQLIDLNIDEAIELFKIPEKYENVLCKGSKLCYQEVKGYNLTNINVKIDKIEAK